MSTIYEVSKLAGVSSATVSRVINKSGPVSEKTLLKVETAMVELGFKPNIFAQSLALNRSNSVGLLIPELHGPFFGQLMTGVEEELTAAGKHLIVSSGHSLESKEESGIQFLLSRNCDALILHVDAVSDEFLQEICAGTTPIVILNRNVEAVSENCIYLNNELGGYLACKSVIASGHKEIAYLSGPAWKEDAKARKRGVLKALEEAGLELPESLDLEGNFRQNGGEEAIEKLVHSEQKFTALICGNDEMAIGALAKARELNLELPEQVSIFGFDNMQYSRCFYPSLSTVDYPIQEMSRNAARMVLAEVYEQDVKYKKGIFDPKIVKRNSVQNLN